MTFKKKDLAAITPVVVVAGLAAALLFLAMRSGLVPLPAALGDFGVKLRETLSDKAGEYLFFMGAACMAFLALERRRWIVGAAALVAAFMWVAVLPSVREYVDSLGVDSFVEARSFDVDEAKFWFTTLREALHLEFHWKRLALYLAAGFALFALLRLLIRAPIARVAVAVLLMGAALHQTVSASVSLFLANAEAFSSTVANFASPVPPALPGGQPLHVLVYIGESTTVMDMGLYGYRRDTTPRLSALAQSDPNLIVFHNVFSTHTHTSQSLLEALSFAVDEREDVLPIHMRRRVSLLEVLREAKVPASLVSNQGRSGSWNQAARIIFRDSPQTYSVDDADHKARLAKAKPWDDAFFDEAAKRGLLAGEGGASVTFFHSYAGHGEYLRNIPPAFRAPVDSTLKGLSPAAVFGAASGSLGTEGIAEVEAYDSAVRYIDFAVARAVDLVRARTEPTVLVYFSDHGESVYTGRGHNSARFVHEMARVPFLLYFNEAAKRGVPELHTRYRALAAARHTATLAQFPATLLDLLGVRIAPGGEGRLVPMAVIGEAAAPHPIVVRKTPEGISFVNLTDEPVSVPRDSGEKFIDKTDEATRRYIAAHRAASAGLLRPCDQRADSLATALREALAAPCRAVQVGDSS